MKRFFDPSRAVLDPQAIVRAFTKKQTHELALPARAIITFDGGDLRRLTEWRGASLVEAWVPFRTIYLLSGTATAATKSSFGGPNIAALVEELSAFGVTEFVLWGYCGGMAPGSKAGDLYLARGALREEGISYHYLEDEDDFVLADWADQWTKAAEAEGVRLADIWTTDAIYRETQNKIDACTARGISGVEMEVASFYAVCKSKGLKAAAFLVVSDVFNNGKWISGFHTRPFKEGVKKLSRFINEKAVI